MGKKNLATIKDRSALEPRREPWWAEPIGTNESLGYYKIGKVGEDRGTWIARKRWPDKPAVRRSLGPVTDRFDYYAAKKAAEKWFADLDQGITGDAVTVADACKRYVETQRKRKKNETNAHDAEMRFKRTVNKAPLGKVFLSDLRKHHIQSWIDNLDMSPASVKRTFTTLKAALNAAVKSELVGVGAKQSWTGVETPDVPDNRRTLFLDLAERRALLEAAGTGGLRDLIEAAMLTGCRAGELTSATRGQLDARTGTMKFKGKTGPRTVPLSGPALVLFKRLAESKLPLAPLLTRDDGKPWAHSDWDELVREAAKAAGLQTGTCLYVLRHSFIVEAISGGLSTLEVARLTGTSIQMIEKHYGAFIPSVAMERLAKVQLV